MHLPYCYSLMFATALYALQPNNRWLCAVAILCGCLDIAENINIHTLLELYESRDISTSTSSYYGPLLTKAKLFLLSILSTVTIGSMMYTKPKAEKKE